MTLLELSVEYRTHARALEVRIYQLKHQLQVGEDPAVTTQLTERIRLLSIMLREARELAVLTERYYDRGYHRDGKYTV